MQAHRLDGSVREPILQDLKDSERDRALRVWSRRFGEPASDALERARQHRFLAQRGFTSDAIVWVLRNGGTSTAGEDLEVD
jgi:regulatory protein